MLTSIFVDDPGDVGPEENDLAVGGEDDFELPTGSGFSAFGRGGLGARARGGRGLNSQGVTQDAAEELELAQDARDDAEDSGTLGEFLLLAPRRRRPRQMLTTVGEVLQLCRDFTSTQIERALDMRDRARPNESITGDNLVRTAILTLLPDAQQRELFLELASNPRSWPRLKPLFGAPPYHFLREQDAGMMRAAGLSKGRTHMVYDTQNPLLSVTTITQFGSGQLVDEHERVYRVVPATPLSDADTIPYRLDSTPDSSNVFMHVKVAKRTREEKMQLLGSSSTKKRCFFPQPGERITLTETTRMMQFIGQRVATETGCTVKRLVPRDQGASTALVVLAVS